MVRYPQPRKILRDPLPHRRWHLFIAGITGISRFQVRILGDSLWQLGPRDTHGRRSTTTL